ncbi:hypothetical protein AG0111_0g12165 [Alternaria gaisen]|uniref:Uncharacterized protein n=1 Tax=Alternaria gaisen TaxID=167740 RepID=A0ACB6F588_9PLEO|nr:hypothetical protein AG0111_0g12165 [Alternaria gaisen]
MPPKTPGDSSNERNNKEELPQSQGTRVLRNRNPKPATSQGLPSSSSNQFSAKNQGMSSGGDIGVFKRPREIVDLELEIRRQKLTKTLQNAEKAAEIPDFETHLRDRARAEELDEDDKDAIIAAASEAVGGSNKFKANVRSKAHENRRVATSLYEDLLYYQTPEHRLQYREEFDETKRIKAKPMRKGLPPALLTEDARYDKKLRPFIDLFEQDNVGATEEIDYEKMGPNNLHVRLPRARRFAVGLGRPRNPHLLSPIELSLDIEVIERRRREVENVEGDQSLTYDSHSERRKRELELSPSLPITCDSSRTLLESGLHIAAGETSFDWKTSYDKRGAVAPGRTPIMPAKPTLELQGDELNEFSKPPMTPIEYNASVGHHHVETTSWAEATDGRRERAKEETMNRMPESDVESSNEDSSDDEGDEFAISYRQCSSLEDCPCSSEDDHGPGGGSGHGYDKEENSRPGAPLSITGGPLDNSQTTQPRTEINPDTNIDLYQNTPPTTKTAPRTQSGAEKMAGPPTARHDYKSGVYNRHQLRQGLKYLGLSQNSPELKELHDRIDRWDREHAPDAVHKYIIKDKRTAVSFMTDKVFDDDWMAQVKAKLDEQNPQTEESGEGSDEEFEEGQGQDFDEEQDPDPEDVDEDEMNVDYASEKGDSGKNSMSGVVDGAFTISTEQQTTNLTTIASSHTSKTPRATKSGEKATGTAGTEPPRRSERNIEK